MRATSDLSCQNHTMIRVKDADKSLDFYQTTMGMKLLRTSENKDNAFNLYFLGYEEDGGPASPHREGLLELTWNYGTEKEADFHYHSGNTEPQGFGHICESRVSSSEGADGRRCIRR